MTETATTETTTLVLDSKTAGILRRLQDDGLIQFADFSVTAAAMSDSELVTQIANYDTDFGGFASGPARRAFRILCEQWFARFERDLAADAA